MAFQPIAKLFGFPPGSTSLRAKLNGAETSDLSDVPIDVPADETDLIDELENL